MMFYLPSLICDINGIDGVLNERFSQNRGRFCLEQKGASRGWVANTQLDTALLFRMF